jgi:hypothetical protein
MAKQFRQVVDQSTWAVKERNKIQQALTDLTGEVPDVFPATQEVAFDINRRLDLVVLKSSVEALVAAQQTRVDQKESRQDALKTKLNLSDEEFQTLRELM